jgi:ankyrin repeat protein
MTKYLSKSDIIKLIEHNDWDRIYSAVVSGEIEKPNKSLINGNNLFHIACIRTQTEFVENVFNLCYSKQTDSDMSAPLSETSKIGCGINPDLANDEGYPGLHLYYKYGGRSKTLLQLSSICFLDKSYDGILKYLINEIELLEVYIDSTIRKACLPNIELGEHRSRSRDKHIYYLLIKEITQLETTESDKNKIQRYLEIIKVLLLNLSNKKVVHYAIAMGSHTVMDYLIKENLFNPLIRNSKQETPLIIAVQLQRKEFVKKILDAYCNLLSGKSGLGDVITSDLPNIKDYIGFYRSFSDGRPINIAIQTKQYKILELLIKYLRNWREETGDTSYHTETDEYNSTYLHNILLESDPQTPDKNPIMKQVKPFVFEYLIKYTDLNQMNYYSYTPAQMLFLKGFWKLDMVKDSLTNRKVDLLKIDIYGRNIYSYIKEKDQKAFMDVTKSFVLLANTNGTSQIESELQDAERIIDVISRDKLKERKGYGLFNPSQLNYIMFMIYLQNKHQNLFIPQRIYDESKKQDQRYMMEITSFPLSEIQSMLDETEIIDHSRFYSYAPHLVSWYDTDLYILNPELVNILKEQDKADPDLKRRFVLIKLLIVLNEKSNHANCLIYDRKKKEAWRFESYGLTDLVRDGEEMDMMLENCLESVYGKIKYYSPSSYLGNIKFQLADDEDYMVARSLGDPGGYCLAWSVWFADVICSNITDDNDNSITVDYLMRNYITRERLNDIFNDVKEGKKGKRKTNIYLEYIRQYGHLLDTEKNTVMANIGVSREMFYKFSASVSDVNKINDYLKVKKVMYN